MLDQQTQEMTAPCPKCRTEMVLAAVTPHPVATQLARHTYLCSRCNQTKTYVLPANAPPGTPGEQELQADGGASAAGGTSAERRDHPREALDAAATVYDKEGRFLLPCVLRDLSKSGGRIELLKEATLPQYFLLSMLPDGSGRRLCSKVWQLALTAGVRFVERNQI
jgi:hypothetical protein